LYIFVLAWYLPLKKTHTKSIFILDAFYPIYDSYYVSDVNPLFRNVYRDVFNLLLLERNQQAAWPRLDTLLEKKYQGNHHRQIC
jgi:hypothetical protein